MNSQLFRAALWATKVPLRTASSAVAGSKNVVLDPKLRDEIYPKIGNREVVGFGLNGQASYVDRCEFPCPAIRFKEVTADIQKLREAEKGDWKKLSLEDKKALYRASFCQTFSEMNASTGEWKAILAGVLFVFAGTGWLILFVRKFVYSPLPHTYTREWQEQSLQRMLDQNQGPIFGVSSRWDNENNQWKS